MEKKKKLLIFRVDQTRCALPLEHVQRTELAVAITPLPDAPDTVAGIINVRGKLMPVINVRHRLGLPDQDLQLDHHFILAKTEKRELALWVEQVSGIEDCCITPQENVTATIAKLPYISGVTAVGDDLVFIHDLEKFLSEDEDRELTQAMGAISL